MLADLVTLTRLLDFAAFLFAEHSFILQLLQTTLTMLDPFRIGFGKSDLQIRQFTWIGALSNFILIFQHLSQFFLHVVLEAFVAGYVFLPYPP